MTCWADAWPQNYNTFQRLLWGCCVEIPARATRKHFEPQKVVRDPGVLTIFASESLSRAGVVQILATSTSKSAPTPSVFNDFDFQIILARRRGANFGDFNFQKWSEPNRSRTQAWCKFWRLQLPKVLPHPQFLMILISKSLSRAGVVQIWVTSKCSEPRSFERFSLPNRSRAQAWCKFCQHLGQPILRTTSLFGPTFPRPRSHKIRKNIACRAIPTRQNLMSHISAVTHLCCITSARSHLLVDKSSAATLSIVGS